MISSSSLDFFFFLGTGAGAGAEATTGVGSDVATGAHAWQLQAGYSTTQKSTLS